MKHPCSDQLQAELVLLRNACQPPVIPQREGSHAHLARRHEGSAVEWEVATADERVFNASESSRQKSQIRFYYFSIFFYSISTVKDSDLRLLLSNASLFPLLD